MDSALPRLLVVDDEHDLREMLEFGLARAGFDVRSAGEGRTALDMMQAWTPEALVLDWMLPGIDGISMLSAVRRISQLPIVMLTARASTADKVLALASGADDYLAKPFEMDELAARLWAALRRPSLEARDIVTYEDLAIDIGRRAVTRGTRRIELSSREFDLLALLARHPGKVFTRTELLDRVWGCDNDAAPTTVETYISYLRAKIDTGAPRLIHTERGVGYTLRAERR